MGSASSRTTDPAPKYGPTPLYGSCEVENCRTGARQSCPACGGHFCLAHGEHADHADQPD